MKRMIFITLIVIFSVFTAGHVQADTPRISNLQFSTNSATLGEEFTISFEFEGHVDKLFIENIWETKNDQIKHEIKEYNIPAETKEQEKGTIIRKWKTTNPNIKPYRILKVWIVDKGGNQSNSLSKEIKVVIPEISKEVPSGEVVHFVTDIKKGSLDLPDYPSCTSNPMNGVKWKYIIHRHNTRPIGGEITKIDIEWDCKSIQDFRGGRTREGTWRISPKSKSNFSDYFFICESGTCKVKLTWTGKYSDGQDIKSTLTIDLK